MLSTEQVRKLLPSGNYTDPQAEEIKDALYQLANVLVSEYLKKKHPKQEGEER